MHKINLISQLLVVKKWSEAAKPLASVLGVRVKFSDVLISYWLFTEIIHLIESNMQSIYDMLFCIEVDKLIFLYCDFLVTFYVFCNFTESQGKLPTVSKKRGELII